MLCKETHASSVTDRTPQCINNAVYIRASATFSRNHWLYVVRLVLTACESVEENAFTYRKIACHTDFYLYAQTTCSNIPVKFR